MTSNSTKCVCRREEDFIFDGGKRQPVYIIKVSKLCPIHSNAKVLTEDEELSERYRRLMEAYDIPHATD